ncbi:hypothetical protein DIURU_004877 [Diutina rugosa]|uniref:Uncharacterized protein n=1 Tax=Diutina rugosa TaxID=5481 RepID=A0A642UFC5_DIURU|nr:uncharacterized protein DIURU_004877 [Diutina rugosa]KAA8898023.1 hypothetical protein DIURU_004877 [Diutina rugosa]
MTRQVDLNLNEPLDAAAKPTLSKTPLVPKYATAAATLQGDYYVQEQSNLNRYLFWSPISKVYMTLVIGTALTYALWDYVVISDTPMEFLQYFRRTEVWVQLVIILPALVLIVISLGLVIFLVSDDLKDVSRNLVGNGYVNEIFGFDLVKFAKLDVDSNVPKQREQLSLGDNTQIIVYRDSPIAIATVVPDPKSTVSDFIVRISGMNIRKVYSKVDFDQLVLEWSIIRARQLLQRRAEKESIKSISGCKITVLVDAYSFDQHRVSLLLKNGFSLLSSTYQLNPFGAAPQHWQVGLQKVFSVARRTYGLVFVVDNEDADLLMKAVKTSGFLATTDNVKRRRPAA